MNVTPRATAWIRTATCALATTLGVGASASALAQPLSAEDFVKALRPDKADSVTGSRSLGDVFNQRGVSAEETATATPSIDIRVNFEFDSIKLENETLLTLRALGTALASEALEKQQILIVGHTDAKGTEEYNAELSQRRAAAVVDYLVRTFDVDAGLITSEGRGESDLLYPDDPENELNRRVEVRNVTRTEGG